MASASRRGASHLGGLGYGLSSFRAKFAYETIIHANRFFMPMDFPLSCVEPWTTASALAMLHLARFQESKVPSTFGQVLFETVDKVIPYGHVEMPFVGVNCAASEQCCTASRHSRRFSDSSRSAWRARSMTVAIEDSGVRVRQMQSLKSGQPCQPNDDYEKLSASQVPAGRRLTLSGVHSRAL
jgi:hypothetical protein